MPLFVVIPLILALLGGGTSLAAQHSLPGDFLYPVKVDVNEKIGNAFHFTNQAKADFEATLAVERLSEAEQLAKENKTVDAAVNADLEARFKTYADRVEQKIADMKAKGNAKAAAEVADRFHSALNAHAEVLASLEDGIDEQGDMDDIASLHTTVREEADDVDDLKAELEADVNDENENESDVRHATSTTDREDQEATSSQNREQDKGDKGESETNVKLELGR